MKRKVSAFFIPIIFFLLGYYLLGHTVKTEDFIISDLQAQYVSLFSYFQDVLTGKESLLYSFHRGMGGSMFATFAYYLSSPLNLILIFFSKSNIPLAILILILIKIGLSGLTMHCYLEKHFGNQKVNYLFSTTYALMGYVTQYYFHVMWLDAVYLLPLVLIGIDNLIDKDKKFLYLACLFISIISNFYTGYMVCIFSLLYFLSQMYLKGKKMYSKTTIHFFVCSLLAGGLSTGLLLPTILELQHVYRYPTNIWNLSSIFRNLKELLAKLYIGAHNCKNTINPNGTNIYCGVFSVLLVYLYFINHKINRKEKTVAFSLVSIMLLSSIVLFFIYIWHGFSLPNCFNNRNSFLFTFLLILIAFRSFQQLEVKKKQLLYFFVGFLIISLILYQTHLIFLPLSEMILTACFLLIYSVLLYAKCNIKSRKSLFTLLFVGFAFFELFLNFVFTFQSKDNEGNLLFSETVAFYSNLDLDNDYRTGSIESYSGLDSLIQKKSSLTSFISTNLKTTHEFLENSGYTTTGITSVNKNGGTIVTDSLLGLKTYFSDYGKIGYNQIKKITWNDSVLNWYQNPYALPLGYLIQQDFNGNSIHSLDYQNQLIASFSGIDEYPLEKVVDIKCDQENYTIPVSPGDYYLQIHYKKGDTLRRELAEVTVNGRKIEEWEVNGIFQVINTDNKIEFTIKPIKGTTIEGISIYQLNEDIWKRQIEVLEKYPMREIKKEKNRLSGRITVPNKKILLLTIPYEKGWNVTVDGKRVKPTKIANTFIGIYLNTGEHEVTLKYIPEGLYLGIFISTLSLGATLIYFNLCKKK